MAKQIPIRDDQPNWLATVRDRIGDTFDRWLHRADPGESSPAQPADFWSSFVGPSGLGPVVDVIDEDDKVRVVAELPGLSRDDFDVRAESQRVFIQGERKDERKKKGRGYSYAERSYGAFSRAIPLPCPVVPEKATATYKDGLLELHLPKAETGKGRKIQVKVS